MAQDTLRPLDGNMRAGWIRLRTMILLRWVAIVGQLSAILFAQYYVGLQLELGLCYLVIGASVIANLVASFVFPENKRLSEVENMFTVLFDLLQLSLLLFLTGGLNNPFALLMLGPVTVSATVLGLRSTIFLGSTAILIVTALSGYHLPLITAQNIELVMPDIFLFGNWIALVIAIIFISAYSVRVTSEIDAMSTALAATQLALSREQKLTDLGGVVAAAAHELGTPLATIKLASGELYDELAGDPDLQEDAALIGQQADRCRDILRDMGRVGKDDPHMHQAPLIAILNEAAEPHLHRGKEVSFVEIGPADTHPVIERQPGIIHGLRNLIQNAVDFAEQSVEIEVNWSGQRISVRIADDGAGFPQHLIGRIGDPFMRHRRQHSDDDQRPEYEGMGLGLFIAKTLLERSGAELTFANGEDQSLVDESQPLSVGAIVEVFWTKGKIPAGQSSNYPKSVKSD